MSENENEQAPPTEGTEEPKILDPNSPALPAALREVDPEKMTDIKAKLAAFMKRRGTTVSGSEDPDAPPAQEPGPQMGGVEGDKPVGEVMTGADVDWSEYDLPFSVRHLYPKAIFRETHQGPKWVAMAEEFYTTERAFKQHGKEVNAPGTSDGEQPEPLNLGEYLTSMVNGPDGWNIAAILPGSSGYAGVILRKQSAVYLPDPIPLKKAEEVTPPQDQELQSVEDAALQFAEEEGLTPPAQTEATEEQGVEEVDLSGRFLSRGEVGVELEEGTGALPARDTHLISEAIDRNRNNPDSYPATAPRGIQPPPVDPDGVFDGAVGVENVRRGLRNILEGPDFGEVKQ